jgi:hypothetical protein
MKLTGLFVATALTLAIAAPTAASAGMMDMSMMHMDMAKMKAAPYADKVAAAMAMAHSEDRDFWQKCTVHKTDACDAALAELMAK